MAVRFLLYLFLWSLVFGSSLLLYQGTSSAALLDDFLSGIIPFQAVGWAGWIDSFGFPSLYYGHNLFFYGFFSLFGLNAFAWHTYMIFFFSLNVCLMGGVLMVFSRDFRWKNPIQTVGMATSLFFVSPYLTENVIWAATLHYQLIMFALWISLWLWRKAILENRVGFAAGAICIWIFSLTCHELALVFPGIWMLFFYFLTKHRKIATLPLLLRITGLSFGVLVIYFLFTFMREGLWMPHYGSEVHLANMKPGTLWSSLLCYVVKIIGFTHFLPYEWRLAVYSMLNEWRISLGIFLVLFGLFFWFGRKSALLRQSLFLYTVSAIALFPVLNLYFMILMPVENDRLAFLALPFLYALPSLFLQYLPVFFRYTVFLVFVFFSVYSQQQVSHSWGMASVVQQRSVQSWKWAHQSSVYVLNNPQNMRGVYVFRDNSRFADAMQVFRNINISEQYVAVAGMNYVKPDDFIEPQWVDSVTVQVNKNGWGWFWKDRVGACDYETKEYSFSLNQAGYVLRFKKRLKENESVVFLNSDYYWQELKYEVH